MLWKMVCAVDRSVQASRLLVFCTLVTELPLPHVDEILQDKQTDIFEESVIILHHLGLGGGEDYPQLRDDTT